MSVIKSGFVDPVYKGRIIPLKYFIVNGYKTVEGRPADGSFKSIKKGDIIDFASFVVTVTDVLVYPNVSEYLDNHQDAIPRETKEDSLAIYKSMIGDKIDKPFLGIKIVPYKQILYYLYHGGTKLDTIKTFKSHLSDKNVCFGTINKYIAASFIPKWSDDDFIHGKHKGKWYMIARYKGASKLLECSGYLNRIKPHDFYRNDKLGLWVEYISEKEQAVVGYEYVDNVRNYIEGFITVIDEPIHWYASADLIFKYGIKKHYMDEILEDKEEPEFHPCLFKPMEYVIKKNGLIIDGLERAKAAAYLGQPYLFIDI